MAQYTCTVDQWDDDTDVIRLFQAEVASYGGREGHDPDGWEVVSQITEIGEDGAVIGELTFPRGPGGPPTSEEAYQRGLYKQVEGLLLADAEKQWNEEDPSSDWTSASPRGY